MRPLFAVLASVSAIVFVGCSKDEVLSSTLPLTDVVTIAAAGSEGTTFTFEKYDDSPQITLIAADYTAESDNVGRRAVLRYVPKFGGAPYESGPIRVLNLSPITTDTLRINKKGIPADWDKDPIWMMSLWRAGSYINIHMRALHSDVPRAFSLTVDEKTLAQPVPQLYLVHNMLDAPDNFKRDYYASFFVGKIWNMKTCHGFDIHVNDSRLPTKIYSFRKTITIPD